MTRKEQIEKAAFEYINSDAVSPMNMQLAFGDFINGAEWADKTMMTHEEEFEEFKELVRRMREAQKELDTCSIGDYGFRQHCAAQLESEVDEYLEKMEICD